MSVCRAMVGFLIAAVIAGGCGGGGNSHHGSAEDDRSPARTVAVTMHDIYYEPTTVTVKADETVKFVFHNEGDIVHDAFIGDEAAQAEHEEEMRKGGKHHGGEDHAVTVDPGKTASLTYTFARPATLVIGCHQAGHYGAGMKINVTVA